MYQKVDNSLDFVSREKEILEFWKKEEIFKKQVELRKGGEDYTFYDGPPTANGKPHIGHVLTRAIKDLIPRYHSMKGKNVLRKAGWDTHGLPVELEVEKALGINGKDEIEAFGVENFIQECKKSVWTYKKDWEVLSERVGYWVDMDDPYVTYEDGYIESEWWAMKEIDKKGLLYQGNKIVPYCPRCGTSLASHEVAQGYKDITDESIYVRFKLEEDDDVFFAAWTTTPWTLPSNLALAVHPDVDYVMVERNEGCCTNYYYLAKDLIDQVFPEEDLDIVREVKGRDLVGLKYEPILPYAKDIVEKSGKKAFEVLPADFVTTADGTGIVHVAPAFGEDDSKVGKEFDLPFVQLVTDQGLLPEEVTDFAGMFVMDANPKITELLAQKGSLIHIRSYGHNYPHCWRCDTPLIYYARQGWFVEMTKVREQLLANNAQVNWIPQNIGEGRFGNFLENVIDWNISRERYWGMPLPIWICPNGHRHVVGSVAELRELSPDCPDDLQLHRPYIDEVHINCPECGELASRVPEVMDCWFDSGAMPFAQWHYPMENEQGFKDHYPADFISEAVDQTRGWFYSLMALGTVLFDEAPFKNCIVLGHVQDKEGVKMSKHVGNVVDPNDVLDKEGADAVRWYFYSNSQPWLPTRFSYDGVNESKRKFMGTLWNTYAFFVLYADIDKFGPEAYDWDKKNLCVMDRWILSKLNSLIKEVSASIEKFDILTATRSLEAFVDDLSNWYVRRGRERYWVADMPQDKVDAYQVLYEVLVKTAQVAAPFTPFMSEMLYQNLVVGKVTDAPISIHLTDYPEVEEDLIDDELERQMELVLKLVNLGRTARSLSQVKTRQPLARMLVVGADQGLGQEFVELVEDELNIKDLEWADDADSLQDYHFKPQLRLLGKRFGPRLNELRGILDNFQDGVAKFKELKANGQIVVEMADGPEILTEEELIIETIQADGFAAASDYGLTVALDTDLTSDLIDEGFLRELVSKIQNQRKESGFEVQNRIKVYLAGSEKLLALAEKFSEALMDDVLAVEIANLSDAPAGIQEAQVWDINGENIEVALEVVE